MTKKNKLATNAPISLSGEARTNKNGFFSADGEIWGTVWKFEEKLGISSKSISSRIKSCPSREGRDQSGKKAIFYSLKDVEASCADLLKKVPRAEATGFFVMKGELWGTVRKFEEKLGISSKSISSRIKSCPSREGRDQSGKKAIFYSLKDVEASCADLLKKVPRAEATGFFVMKGELWGTVRATAKRLGIDRDAILSHTKFYRSQAGKTFRGRRATFYPLKDIETVLATLIQELPKADADGFYETEGELWGSLSAVAKKIKLRVRTLAQYTEGCRMLKGKDPIGRPCILYNLSDVNTKCAHLLKELPKADADGFFLKDGETWGTLNAIARKLRLNRKMLWRKCSSCRSLKGKTREGKTTEGFVATFYALTDVKKVCEDILRGLPKADADGFFLKDGETWGTLNAIARKLRVVHRTLRERCMHFRSRKGRINDDRIFTFYSVSDAECTCASILARKPVPNPVTKVVLTNHAPVMARVLKTLRNEREDVVSDHLWKVITTRWTEYQFLEAVATFKKSGNITSFAKLLN